MNDQDRRVLLSRYAVLAAEYAQTKEEGVLEKLHDIEDRLEMTPKEITAEILRQSGESQQRIS